MKPLSLLVLLLAAPFAAAAPKVDNLFPAGGQRGASVHVFATGTFDAWPVEIWASHPGIVGTPGKSSGHVDLKIADDVPCGLHWLRFIDKTGPSALKPFLVNQLPEFEEKEPNDDWRKPQTVPLPAIVNGRLDKNDDVDHYAVSLKKGQTLVAAITANRTLRSPMDGVLEIVSPEGFVLAHNDDYRGIDPLLAFEVPKDGVYVVRLFAFAAQPDSRIGFFGKDTCIYRLTLTTGPFVDRTWPLAVDREHPGEVELLGWNILADRKRVAVKPAEGEDRVFLQPPDFASGVWLRTEPHPATEWTAKLGPAPVSVSGRFAKPGDRATLSFEGTKKKPVSIAIEARDLDLPVDAILTVRSPAGKSLQAARSVKLNVDPALEFTPTDDGPCTLEVRDLHDGGGPRYEFLVRIRPVSQLFDVTTASDKIDGTANKPIDISLAIDGKGSPKGPLEARVEGLPDGAKAEVVAGKDAKKATVRLSGIDSAFQGGIRIFVRSEGQPERVVNLAAEPKTPWLWLAVKEK